MRDLRKASAAPLNVTRVPRTRAPGAVRQARRIRDCVWIFQSLEMEGFIESSTSAAPVAERETGTAKPRAFAMPFRRALKVTGTDKSRRPSSTLTTGSPSFWTR